MDLGFWIKIIIKEWDKLTELPILAVTLFCAGAMIFFFIAKFAYRREISTLKTRIDLLETQKNKIEMEHKRPFLIFDINKIVYYDNGANELLESIEANTIQPLSKYEIIITPKNILHSAPLLEPIDSYNFVVNSKRGKGFQWVYDLDIISYTDTTNVPRFKLEILTPADRRKRRLIGALCF